VVIFRGAVLSLGGEGFIMQAAMTLTVSLVIRTLISGFYLILREPRQIRLVLVHWLKSLLVGIAGALASIFWFSAFTLTNAAYVRALSQIELVFTIMVSILFFHKKIKRLELVGTIFIIIGILIQILSGI
jgi:uncharacterized membrane protein